MTQHTPGPWGSEAAPSSDHDSIRWITGPDGTRIAKVRDLSTRRCEPKGTMVESIANTHIIRAAPDLLEALKYATALLDERDAEVLALCRQAIAKAEGRR